MPRADQFPKLAWMISVGGRLVSIRQAQIVFGEPRYFAHALAMAFVCLEIGLRLSAGTGVQAGSPLRQFVWS